MFGKKLCYNRTTYGCSTFFMREIRSWRDDMSITIESNSAEETFALGQKIGERVKPGTIISLTGDLGVGKTVFTQGLAKGLGIMEPGK